MAIEVGDKIYRNLPEQVEWLSNQFVRILEAFEELGTVMRYKGSVATYADLPADNNKVGDVYNVIDTGSNYAWDGEGWDEIGSTVDLSNLVTLDTAQDITGQKTIKNIMTFKSLNDTYNVTFEMNDNGSLYLYTSNISNPLFIIGGGRVTSGPFRPLSDNNYDLGTSSLRWKDLYLSDAIYGSTGQKDIDLSGGGISLGRELYTGLIRPRSSNVSDIGTSIMLYKDLYISGSLKDGTNSVAVSQIATADQIDYIVLKNHTQSGALTGGEVYKMRNGGFVPTFASFNGNQRQSIFMQLTYISGTSYKAQGWFLDSSRNLYIYEGTISNVAEDSSTNASYSSFTEVKMTNIAIKPTTVSIPIDNQTNTADISSYSGKIVVLYAADTAGGTWEVTFTLPSTIIAVGITKSGSTQIEISGTSITNHTLNIINLDELDISAFCVIDLSDGLTAKVMAGRNF